MEGGWRGLQGKLSGEERRKGGLLTSDEWREVYESAEAALNDEQFMKGFQSAAEGLTEWSEDLAPLKAMAPSSRLLLKPLVAREQYEHPLSIGRGRHSGLRWYRNMRPMAVGRGRHSGLRWCWNMRPMVSRPWRAQRTAVALEQHGPLSIGRGRHSGLR